MLTVTLETNVVLDRLYSASIHITDLDIIDSPSGMVDLYSDRNNWDGRKLDCFAGDPCDLFRACIDPVQINRCPKATAAWDNQHKTLRLYVGNKLPIIYHAVTEGRPLSFSLVLDNSADSDTLVKPYISGYGVSQTGRNIDVINPVAVPTGLGFTWLSTKNIGQSNPYPKALNTLTMTLTVTQTVYERTGAAVSVTGLMGKSWPYDVVNLTDPTGNNMHLRFMDAFPDGELGFGKWYGVCGLLEFSLSLVWLYHLLQFPLSVVWCISFIGIFKRNQTQRARPQLMTLRARPVRHACCSVLRDHSLPCG